jgi:hypothetical protein
MYCNNSIGSLFEGGQQGNTQRLSQKASRRRHKHLSRHQKLQRASISALLALPTYSRTSTTSCSIPVLRLRSVSLTWTGCPVAAPCWTAAAWRTMAMAAPWPSPSWSPASWRPPAASSSATTLASQVRHRSPRRRYGSLALGLDSGVRSWLVPHFGVPV